MLVLVRDFSHDAADNGFYVIKQLKVIGLGPKEQQEALNEVHILHALDHPNVTRYFESFVDDGNLNIVMELAEHGTLHDRLKVHVHDSTRTIY